MTCLVPPWARGDGGCWRGRLRRAMRRGGWLYWRVAWCETREVAPSRLSRAESSNGAWDKYAVYDCLQLRCQASSPCTDCRMWPRAPSRHRNWSPVARSHHAAHTLYLTVVHVHTTAPGARWILARLCSVLFCSALLGAGGGDAGMLGMLGMLEDRWRIAGAAYRGFD